MLVWLLPTVALSLANPYCPILFDAFPTHLLVRKATFCLHTWHWIIKRTFTWRDMDRRLSKENNRTLRYANTWIAVANIRRTLKFC